MAKVQQSYEWRVAPEPSNSNDTPEVLRDNDWVNSIYKDGFTMFPKASRIRLAQPLLKMRNLVSGAKANTATIEQIEADALDYKKQFEDWTNTSSTSLDFPGKEGAVVEEAYQTSSFHSYLYWQAMTALAKLLLSELNEIRTNDETLETSQGVLAQVAKLTDVTDIAGYYFYTGLPSDVTKETAYIDLAEKHGFKSSDYFKKRYLKMANPKFRRAATQTAHDRLQRIRLALIDAEESTEMIDTEISLVKKLLH